MCSETTGPAHPVDVEVVRHEGVNVIIIQVPIADPGPVATRDGVYKKRAIGSDGKPQCIALGPNEVVSRGLVSRNIDYAATPARGATFDDLDPVEFDRFRKRAASQGDVALANLSDHDMVQALGLVPRGEPISLGAVLLFGKTQALSRWVPTAEVLFQDDRPGYQANQRFCFPSWLWRKNSPPSSTHETLSMSSWWDYTVWTSHSFRRSPAAKP